MAAFSSRRTFCASSYKAMKNELIDFRGVGGLLPASLSRPGNVDAFAAERQSRLGGDRGVRSMLKVATLILLVVCSFSPFSMTAVEGRKHTLKLGTLAPTGTSFHKQLMLLKDRWGKASSGAVQLMVYPDGRQGTEAEMVAAMGLGSLQAGLLTAAGLSQIEPSVVALQSMPVAFRSLEEVDQIAVRMAPMLEQRLSAKGYAVLFWSDSGWVRFFTKQAVTLPDDLRKLKLFSWAGGKGEFEAWRAAGFNPVALEPNEIFSSLGTGIISAAPMPPFFALATQVDTVAPFMLEINWAPLVGALVVRKDAWEKISEAQRSELLKIASEIGGEIKARGRSEAAESVAAMKKRKLKVQPMNAEAQAAWDSAADKIRDKIRGPVVPVDLYDAVQGHLKDIRSGSGAGK
ncbi:MAG: C4-dicarboxylate ABC transporter substrate-binding protein [Verrucomicrobia bacterium]|nr:C4-dicarboxylate ABC transporter substrate-binding protein [Verrucomicrobiota bacterium]